MERSEILNLLNDPKFQLSKIADIKKLIISYLLLNPSLLIDIGVMCIETNINNENKNGNDNIDELVCDNMMLYEFLWIKYISKNLPESKGLLNFKKEFNRAVYLYKEDTETILSNKNIDRYEIIKNNAKNTIKLFELYNYNKFNEIISTIKNMNYYDIEHKHQIFLLNLLSNSSISIVSQNIKDKNLEIISLLINSGASVNAKNYNQGTALIIVCKSINLDIIKLLCDNGAKINDKGSNGRTPLMLSCGNYHK